MYEVLLPGLPTNLDLPQFLEKENNTYKISLHIVINNVYVKNRFFLKKLIKEFSSLMTYYIIILLIQVYKPTTIV
jgi:hypothetical protein